MRCKMVILLLVSITIPITSWSGDQAVGFKKMKQKGSLFYYSGRVVMEGEYSYSKSDISQEIIGDQVYFHPTEKDGKLIPRDNDDHRSPWFCFKSSQKAKDLLGLSGLLNNPKVCEVSGVATVEITNYVVDKAETETNDTAELVRVIKKSKPKTKAYSKSGQECQ